MIQNIVQSENFFFQILYIAPIPVEHYTEKWEKTFEIVYWSQNVVINNYEVFFY